MNKCLIITLTLIFSFYVSATIAETQVIYPASQSEKDVRFNDLIEILGTVLEKTKVEYGDYQLVPSSIVMSESRYIKELMLGSRLSVIWSSTSADKERLMIPIRIPLRKGLLGYRISLVNDQRQAEIDKILTNKDLQKVSIGQGIGWGDVTIYEHNGIKVDTSNYESLFKMINAKRFLLFPRCISEAFVELEQRKSIPHLALEPRLLIMYPWPYYYFVNKNNAALAERITKGLEIMIADGSFDQIFHKYNDEAIRKANMSHRRVIRIENPLLPMATPLDNKKLWLDPQNQP